MAIRADTRSRASIGGHPVHPMLIPFPVALLATAAATDVLYLGTRDRNWAKSSRWLLRAGVVTGGIAAPFGLTDFLTIPEARRHPAGWIHLIGNAAVLGLAAFNLSIRQKRAERRIYPLGVALSAGAAGILLVTGWFGGELAYRSGVGVSLKRDERPPTSEPERLSEARRRTAGRHAGGPGVPVMAPDVSGADAPELMAMREADTPHEE